MAVLSRHDVSRLIDEGHAIVIYGNQVLKLNAWLARHPGGGIGTRASIADPAADKIIHHMVGKNATEEMNR